MPTVDTNHPLIQSHADLDRLGALDPTKGRIPVGVEIARLSCLKSPGLLTKGYFCSPFSFLCQAMGYPKALRAIKRDKVFAQELFDYAENQAIFPYLRAMAAVGVKAAGGPDAWSAFPDLTPDLVEEWVIPSMVRLAERGKKDLGMDVGAGVAAADYCEEDPNKFDKAIMFKCWETGLKVNPAMLFGYMGPTQKWNMHWLQEFALTHGPNGTKQPIFLALNGRFVRDSSPDQIIQKLTEWFDILGRDGGLLITIANVPSDTAPEKIHNVIRAAHTLGAYPIAGDLSAVKVDKPQYQPFDEWLKNQPEADIIFKARE